MKYRDLTVTVKETGRKDMAFFIRSYEAIIRTPRGISTRQVITFIEEYYDEMLKYYTKMKKKLAAVKVVKSRRETCEKKINKYIEKYKNRFPEITSVKFKDYKSKWGNCNSRRELKFNWVVGRAPARVIKYLVLHELCHLIEMNHSPRFWKLLEKHFPKYKEAQKWLYGNGGALW